MENNLCFDPGTTPTPFPINFQEHFKFLKHNQAVQTGYLRDASDKCSVQGEYLNIQKVFCHESNFPRSPTQQGFNESWNYKKIFTEEEVMNFTNRRFPRPSICEGDSSPMKKRPEPKPIIGLKMDLPDFHKPNRRNDHVIMKGRKDVPRIELVELNQSDTILDDLNTQVSWTDTILDEMSRTDTHLDKLSKHVRSSELVRPPEKLEMANLLSDEPKTNSIMPKVIIHVLNVQESLGLDGFQKDSKTDLFESNGETEKNWLRKKDGFRPGLKETCLGPYQEHILHFSKSWSWLYQEAVQVSVKDFI
ncbi:hypothetical protein F2Q68_00006203 [Brassica cretica]|nr:hypothetical protein F2Q68_00006203 [Brassica cretica]